jgi:hypothetical protein
MNTRKLVERIDAIERGDSNDRPYDLLLKIRDELLDIGGGDAQININDYITVQWLHRDDIAAAIDSGCPSAGGINDEDEARRRAGVLDEDEVIEIARATADNLAEEFWTALYYAIEEVQPDLLKGTDDEG